MKFYHELNKIKQVVTETTVFPKVPVDYVEDAFFVQPNPSGAMVTRNLISIEGRAPENSIVCVLKDSKIVAVTLPKNGDFLFEEIQLERNVNKFVVRAISDSGPTIDLETFEITYYPPSQNYLARDFTRGDPLKNQIALTFDGNYLDNVTEPILNILALKQVSATFFLTGYFIEHFPERVLRMMQEGHQVGNHTWSHPHLTMYETTHEHSIKPDITRERIRTELMKPAEAFKKLTGEEMSRYWRAPFGEHNYQIRAWAAELGYRQIGWTFDYKIKLSLDTMDWVADTTSNLYRKPADILNKILIFAKQSEHSLNGGIILMHLGSNRKSEFPHQILDALVDSLHNRDFEFVKVAAMQF